MKAPVTAQEASWARATYRSAATLLLILVALMVTASSVSAHATLLFTIPTIDGTVATSPQAVALVFDKPVALSAAPLRLLDGAGEQVKLGQGELRREGRHLIVPVEEELQPGVFLVQWQVTGTDGDVMGGEFRFGVGPTGAPLGDSGAETFTVGYAWTAMLRWLLFSSYALAAGCLVAPRLLRKVAAGEGLTLPRPHLRTWLMVGLVAALGLAAVLAGEGDPHLALDDLSALLDTRAGRLAAVEVVAFAGAALTAGQVHYRWAGGFLIAVAVAEGIRSHPGSAVGWWGALSAAVHVLAAAVWIGALVYALRTAYAWRSCTGVHRQMWGVYGRLAAWLFVVVLLTGTVNALVVLPFESWLSTTYGQLLLAKLALVAVVSLAAVISRLRIKGSTGPRIMPRIEAGALVLVLAVAGILTVTAPPPTADAALPFPPQSTGPVLAVGGRAGEIGIAATVSQDQVVLRLTAPRLAGQAPPAYNLTATLMGPTDHEPQELPLRDCGAGCFVASPSWETGQSTLTLRAGATNWRGGTAALVIDWPVREAPELLRRAVSTMRRTDHLIVYERVTSDTNADFGMASRLRLSGRRFVETEPYAGGRAASSAVVGGGGDAQTLVLGYPGEEIAIRLTLDASNRIVRETLTAPYHLIERTFVYPEHAHTHTSKTPDDVDSAHRPVTPVESVRTLR